MASTIKLKNGSGAPTTGDLVQGEPALDLTNKRLYTENASGVVIEVGTNPSALTIGGTALTATATELNVLDGITATTAELNYTDGVTSNIQTQLNTKAPIASPTFTGTATIPTADINGGTIDGTVIGGSTPAAGTFTTFTSTGIDDNAASTAITIDASQNVGIGTASALAGGVLSVEQGSGTHAIVANSNTSSIPSIYLRSIGGTATESRITFNDSTALSFTTTSTERMRIDSAGNVGIGTTSPSYKLSLEDTTQAGTTIQLFRTGSAAGSMFINGGLAFGADGGNGDTQRMVISSSTGNVGIGTDSPSTSLDISKSDDARLSLTDTGDSSTLIIRSDGVNTSIGTSTAHPLRFTTNDTEAMRISSSGNVGIGDAVPDRKLHVNSGSSNVVAKFESTDAVAAIEFVDSTGSAEIGNSGNNIVFFPAGTERMRIDSSGNLLVGTTGTFNSSSHCFSSNAVSYAVGLRQQNASGSGLHIEVNANNGIQQLLYGIGAGTNTFIVYSNGNVENANNSYGAISDSKLKENIVDASPKLADLMQVKVRNYNLIGDTAKQLGVVAQELETVFPAMVEEAPDRDKDGNDLGTTTKSVKYSVFVPMLIKAMQEQQEQIQDLKAEVAALKGAN